MKRRNFLKITGAAGISAFLPFDFSFQSYTTPKYAAATYIKDSPYTLYNYDRMLKYAVCNDDSVYIRELSVVKAADNVTKQDIINEIKDKWNNPDAHITTCAAEGDFGLDLGTFRAHMKIKDLKDTIDNIERYRLKYDGPPYGPESFARERIEGRERHNSPEETAQRKKHEEYINGFS